jgi:hypothetical protein
MHQMTTDALKGIAETMIRWTTNITKADSYITAVHENFPEDYVDGSEAYSSFDTYYGELTINIYQADEVAQVGPYMRALRFAGFKRVSKKDNVAAKSIEWLYAAGEGEAKVEAKVTLHLKAGEQAACRYVKTGTTEVDVNELLCGEALEAWIEANEVRELA